MEGRKRSGQEREDRSRCVEIRRVPDRQTGRAAIGDYCGSGGAAQGNPQEIAIEAMNNSLGGMFGARLNMNLRKTSTGRTERAPFFATPARSGRFTRSRPYKLTRRRKRWWR